MEDVSVDTSVDFFDLSALKMGDRLVLSVYRYPKARNGAPSSEMPRRITVMPLTDSANWAAETALVAVSDPAFRGRYVLPNTLRAYADNKEITQPGEDRHGVSSWSLEAVDKWLGDERYVGRMDLYRWSLPSKRLNLASLPVGSIVRLYSATAQATVFVRGGKSRYAIQFSLNKYDSLDSDLETEEVVLGEPVAFTYDSGMSSLLYYEVIRPTDDID